MKNHSAKLRGGSCLNIAAAVPRYGGDPGEPRPPGMLGSPRLGPIGDDDVFLTRKETAETLRRSVPTLERWAADGRLRPIRLGGKVLYRLSSIKAFIAAAEA